MMLMQKEVKKVPLLRFPEFCEIWQETPLKALCEFFDSKRVPLSQSERARRQGPYPYFGASGIIDFVDDYLFDGEYILLGEDGANILNRSTPLAFVVSGKIWVNNHAHIMRANGSNKFLAECLERITYEKYNTGTAQPKLNAEVCKGIRLGVPKLPEQQKIASFLTAVDKKIEQLTRKKELFEQYKKGVMQKIFSQEIRFKDDDGQDYPGWEEKELKPFLIKHDEKSVINNQYPVLTSSRQGIMFQTDYYKGNEVASKDNTGYNVVPHGYFTYRHMSDDLVFKFNINAVIQKAPVGSMFDRICQKPVVSWPLK